MERLVTLQGFKKVRPYFQTNIFPANPAKHEAWLREIFLSYRPFRLVATIITNNQQLLTNSLLKHHITHKKQPHNICLAMMFSCCLCGIGSPGRPLKFASLLVCAVP